MIKYRAKTKNSQVPCFELHKDYPIFDETFSFRHEFVLLYFYNYCTWYPIPKHEFIIFQNVKTFFCLFSLSVNGYVEKNAQTYALSSLICLSTKDKLPSNSNLRDSILQIF